ncbi:MAG: D-aminoacyl-tRNA deacylase [Planctomycetota bacterium]
MRVLVQRVLRAEVRVGREVVGTVGHGLLLLVGIGHRDTELELSWMARKVARLRIFRDDQGLMNRSVLDIGGGILSVSQFTLYGDCLKGNRPSFVESAPGDRAAPWIERFAELLREAGVGHVASGRFGAMMEVESVNDGPVTLWIEREAPTGERNDAQPGP